MILAWVCAAWAAEPREHRSETRLAAMAVARTKNRIWTGEALQLGITHQFPTPFVLGLDIAGVLDQTPGYSVDDDGGLTFGRTPRPTIELLPHVGYTVRVERVDATPVLRLSGEGELELAATLRWWCSDHWSFQGQFGPRSLADVDGGHFEAGLGVAWRGRVPASD